MATKYNYFDSFVAQTEICLEEAELLVEAVENFTSAAAIADIIPRAHEIEHRGDVINHEIYNRISVDFVTPIERDDLISIAQCLDEVTDLLEEIMLSFYMYDIRFMHEAAKEFAGIIKKSCEALNAGMKEFKNFKKAPNLQQHMIAINDFEEEGDRLYFKAMRKLYTEDEDNPMRVLVWSRIFNQMENCCDACEHVADVVATAVLKNS